MIQLLDRLGLGFRPGPFQHLDLGQHDVFQHGQMRKGVELLEDDADLAAQLV